MDNIKIQIVEVLNEREDVTIQKLLPLKEFVDIIKEEFLNDNLFTKSEIIFLKEFLRNSNMEIKTFNIFDNKLKHLENLIK